MVDGVVIDDTFYNYWYTLVWVNIVLTVFRSFLCIANYSHILFIFNFNFLMLNLVFPEIEEIKIF